MLRNITQNKILAHHPYVAFTWFSRAQGMIGKKFKDFDALLIPSCRSVHTWFMTQSIDLIFVDTEKYVVEFRTQVKPWRMISGPSLANTVIELKAGTLCAGSLQRHDLLSW